MTPAERWPFPALYPILDADWVLREAASDHRARWSLLRSLVRELAEVGVKILQYRNKRDDDLLVAQDALVIREAAPAMQLILNDRPSLVPPAGWHGVHLGQGDRPAAEVRGLLGRGAIIGLSTHSDEQVRLADAQPVDYIAIGPVFRTATKSDASPVIGVAGVESARALTRRPLVAIGGISLENAQAVYDAGADSIAVISAAFPRGGSPAAAARELLAITARGQLPGVPAAWRYGIHP